MEYKTKEEAIEDLKKINNNISLLMREKRALQDFIRNSEGIDLKTRAFQLQNDENFIKLHGRQRTPKEIGNIMGYSKRSVYRFLEEE